MWWPILPQQWPDHQELPSTSPPYSLLTTTSVTPTNNIQHSSSTYISSPTFSLCLPYIDCGRRQVGGHTKGEVVIYTHRESTVPHPVCVCREETICSKPLWHCFISWRPGMTPRLSSNSGNVFLSLLTLVLYYHDGVLWIDDVQVYRPPPDDVSTTVLDCPVACGDLQWVWFASIRTEFDSSCLEIEHLFDCCHPN